VAHRQSSLRKIISNEIGIILVWAVVNIFSISMVMLGEYLRLFGGESENLTGLFLILIGTILATSVAVGLVYRIFSNSIALGIYNYGKSKEKRGQSKLNAWSSIEYGFSFFLFLLCAGVISGSVIALGEFIVVSEFTGVECDVLDWADEVEDCNDYVTSEGYILMALASASAYSIYLGAVVCILSKLIADSITRGLLNGRLHKALGNHLETTSYKEERND